QQSYGCRRGHPGDARGGAERCRPAQGELVADLARETADRRVIEIGRQQQFLVAPERRNILLLSLEIAGITRVDLELLGDIWCQCRQLGPYSSEPHSIDPGISKELRCAAGDAVLIDGNAVALQRRGR